MKTKLSLAASTTVVALVGLVFLPDLKASTAVSDPVGYITVNVTGAAGTVPRLTGISPTLVTKVEFGSAVAGVAGTVVTTGGTMTAGAYNAASAANPPYWVEVTSDPDGAGPLKAGLWTDILSNTATTITTADNLSLYGIDNQDTIVIRKHQTISSFFGANNEAGLKPGTGIANADEVIIFQGTAPTVKVFYITGSGWFTSSFAPAGNLIIPPNQGIVIKRKLAGDLSFVVAGHVKMGSTVQAVETGYNYLQVLSPVGQSGATPLYTLETSRLQDYLTPGTGPANADQVFIYRPNGTSSSYFYIAGTGWFTPSFALSNNVVLAEGSTVIVRRKTGGPVNYFHPGPVVGP